MGEIVVDTNVVVWYFGDFSKLTKLAETTIDEAAENATVLVPTIVLVELVYLTERNRVPSGVLTGIREALIDDSTAFVSVELTREIADELANIDRNIVADMPDRIIAATAKYLSLPLVTSDGELQKLTNVRTMW
ncbi:MAG: PIN domain-containing protein [Acidobacteria bacterium]|nr:PIN domain-containing protein [Acidobacteriota bacterium]